MCKSTHWALVGNISFLLAALLWVVAPILCFGDKDECSEVEMAANAGYVLNCLLLYVDWFFQRREGFSSVFGQRVLLTQTRRSTVYYWILMIDWYFLSNSVFMVGCVGDFLTSYYSYFETDDFLANLWYLVSSCLWMVSAAVDFYGLLLDQQVRRRLDAAVQVTMIPCDSRTRHEFSYQMLGAMMFFAANVCYASSCLLCWNDYHLACDIFELTGASLFVLYSLVLFIDLYRDYRRPESDTNALLARNSEDDLNNNDFEMASATSSHSLAHAKNHSKNVDMLGSAVESTTPAVEIEED